MEIAGFVKNSFVDYPENISATVFTCGCNMNCWYCHNHDIIALNKGEYDEDKILAFLKERKGFLDGVVVSGGEPTLQPDLAQFMAKLKSLGYLVKLDTNGTHPEVVKDLIEKKLVDYVAMDIKAPFSKYNVITKVDNMDAIKQCVNLIKNSRINYEFRTTFAPNLTVDDIKTLITELGQIECFSLQEYKQPSHITKEVLPKHLPSEFKEIKEFSAPFVKKFNIKNL